MMEPADTFEHAGLTVRIVWEEFDQEHANPRDVDGNVGVMFCDHPNYTLGDKDTEDPRDRQVECPTCNGSGDSKQYEIRDARVYGSVAVSDRLFDSLQDAEAFIERQEPDDGCWMAEIADCPKCEGSGEVEVDLLTYLKREHDSTVILPLFLYDHSGLSMSCGANLLAGADTFSRKNRVVSDSYGWDVSSVGVIYDTAETRKQLTDASPENVEKILTEEVRYYSAYLEGNVYGYQVVDPEDEDEILDSCWGFLELNVMADDAYVREEAKSAAESCAEDIVHERELAYEAACRDVVTV